MAQPIYTYRWFDSPVLKYSKRNELGGDAHGGDMVYVKKGIY